MTDREPTTIRRRAFLNGLLTTTALVASGPAWAQHAHGTQGAPVRALTTPRTAAAPAIVTPAQGPALVNPPVIAPAGNGSFGLTAQMVQTNMVTGTGQSAIAQPVYLRAFVDSNNLPAANAPIVPPTIAIANNGQAQNVSVVLTNNLPAEPVPEAAGAITQAAVPTNPHGFNTINLHTHGLHVSPLQDNVYIELQPAANGPSAACTPSAATPVWACNGTYTYGYTFGQTQGGGTTQIPAGTYWYHPHKHGSVGAQVASGMAGAFIVRGDLDAISNMPPQQQESVLVVQLIPYTAGPTPGSPSVVDPVNFYGINATTPAPTANLQMSVNGQINPTIAMQYGQIQRWRVVNATAEQFFYLQVAQGGTPVASPALFAIAVDGVPLTNSPTTGIPVPFPLGAPSSSPANLAQAALNEIAILAPGQRLDLLVQAPTSGTNGATFNVNAMQWTAGGVPPIATPNQTIATIAISGTAQTAATLPAASAFGANSLIRPPLTGTVPTAPTQSIQFGFINGAAGGLVNNPTATPPNPPTPFTPATSFALPQPPSPAPLPAQLQLKLNAVDLWQVSSDPVNGFGPHAFHIHINSFMITQRYGINLAPAMIWRDTVRIEQGPTTGPAPTVQFVSQQVDYTGDFVMHCHVLEHEDAGMMWSVNIS
ncbi:MAG: multicopper oxidase domain-containing protein [Tagaea sp.]|nr:multicopper oxidase domain-containing protein [Tagaea sp.]